MQYACAVSSTVDYPFLTIFFHIITQKAPVFFLKKKVIDHKMHGFIFSTTFVGNIFHSKKNWARYDINVLHWSSCKISAVLARFYSSLNFLDRFSTHTQNIKMYAKPSSGSRVPRRRTRRTNIRFSQFYERPLKRKKDNVYNTLIIEHLFVNCICTSNTSEST